MNERDETAATKNRMDEETADFYDRVRNAYLGIAAREPDRFHVVDAEGSIDAIHKYVVETVNVFLN